MGDLYSNSTAFRGVLVPSGIYDQIVYVTTSATAAGQTGVAVTANTTADVYATATFCAGTSFTNIRYAGPTASNYFSIYAATASKANPVNGANIYDNVGSYVLNNGNDLGAFYDKDTILAIRQVTGGTGTHPFLLQAWLDQNNQSDLWKAL